MPASSCPSPAVLYANARSRRGQEWFRESIDILAKDGLVLAEAKLIRRPGELFERVREAAARGVPLVIVGGGDGTISSVVQHFVGSESVMGVLPLGTGNSLARDLAIPSNLVGACEAISRGCTRDIDLGRVGDGYFVNVITVGLTERIVNALTYESKKRLGRAAYLFAIARALTRVKPFRAKLITPEQTLEFDTLQVVIGNGRYHAGPFPIAEDASITEGKLSAYALASTNRAAFFKLALAMRTGEQGKLPNVLSLSTSEGRLESVPKRNVVVDGEVELTTPIDFSVVPGAIRVRTPKEFTG